MSRKLSISAGAHMNQSIKLWYLNNYHVLENLSIDTESSNIDYAEHYIERQGCKACSGPCTSRFSGEVHDPDVGELNPVKSFCSLLLSISNECNLRIHKNFLGRGNYLHDCWHRLKTALAFNGDLSIIYNYKTSVISEAFTAGQYKLTWAAFKYICWLIPVESGTAGY